MGTTDNQLLKQAKARLYNELVHYSNRMLTKAEIQIAYLLSNDPDVQEDLVRVAKSNGS